MNDDAQSKQNFLNDQMAKQLDRVPTASTDMAAREPSTLNLQLDRFNNQTEHLRSLVDRTQSLINNLQGPEPRPEDKEPGLNADSILGAFQGNLDVNEELLNRMSDLVLKLETHV